MIAAAIAASELAFWALLLGGLVARYVLGRPRLGAALLLGVPLADAVLLALAGLDLAGGARADTTHGLAAVYLGFSAVLGPDLVRRVDRRFARRFAPAGRGGGRPAATAAAGGRRDEWRLWGRCVLACALAAAVLGLLILVAGDADRTQALWAGGGWFAQLGVISAVWLLAGPVSATVAAHRPRLPRRTPA